MSNVNEINETLSGPTAPKDPIERRSGFYIAFETIIEATARKGGRPSQELYLAGEQLKNKARLAGGITNEDILEHLETCEGFHQLVHSVGITVKPVNVSSDTIHFVFQNWGKTVMYETGTVLTKEIPMDGAEHIIVLSEYKWLEDDDVPGKFAFEFEKEGEMAEVTIKFYLNDGYEVPEFSPEDPVNYGSTMYKEMIAKSLVSKGNTLRLKNAIEKAKRGDDVTIAFIGGSITQGAGAKPIHSNCYAYKTYVQFKEKFAKGDGENVHFIKAGVGGTPSQFGMIRYERDILRDGKVKPDIVIIEFAVNDAGDETKGDCFESLVLKSLAATNNPAVILLFSVFPNDWNLQDRLAPVGYHYHLPMVSVKDAVVNQFNQSKNEGNIISKRQFFYDIYHPTNDGHTIMADCLMNLIEQVDQTARDFEDIQLLKEPIIGNSFKNVRLLDRRDGDKGVVIEEGSFTEYDTDLQMVEMDNHPSGRPQLPYNWMKPVGSENVSFKMTIRCKSLLLIFKDSGDSEFGKANVYINGEYARTFDPHKNNWTHCNAVILLNEAQCKDYTIEIKMVNEDKDKKFTILGFGYTVE
ncbi:SGNH/GDSL hydrolase family protein [Bacillus timonensis]|uniref:SGNH/GDSL hydrolase family protein n=1 Tax=Bacillus timonensis TaxID=1033734 RepID=UPI000288F77C|nr:SGNH/GDSL hydrolase family protein [Bacillus timonensis]